MGKRAEAEIEMQAVNRGGLLLTQCAHQNRNTVVQSEIKGSEQKLKGGITGSTEC